MDSQGSCPIVAFGVGEISNVGVSDVWAAFGELVLVDVGEENGSRVAEMEVAVDRFWIVAVELGD